MAWLRPKTKQLRVFFALCFLLSSVATADDLVHAAPPTGHSALLNGMHDIESTTWLTTATSGCDKGWLTDLRYIGTSGTPHAECHTAATQAGISIIQRLDVSGSESYPRHANSINGYAQGFAHYASRCPNIRVWIVGNEPNFTEHKSDPDCTSAAYAAAYIEVHRRVHSLPGNHVVLVASNSPYSPGCLESLRQIIKHIQQAGIQPDGFAIHAYTRAANAQSLNASYVTSTQTQRDTTRKECPGSAQWDDTWHSHFRIYIDYIRVIEAAGLAGKPVLITESGNACDPNRGNACYPNADIGYFQALYAEANRWNTQASTRTKIRAITPYRWTSNDDGTGRDFAIGQRPLLLQDLQRAFAHQYHWTTPGCGPQSCKHDGECTAPQICDTATSRCVDPKPPSCQKAEDCDSKSICSPATCPDASGICIARGAGAFSFDPAVPKPGQALKVSYQHPQGLTHIGLSFCGPTQGTGSLINIDRAANGDFRWNFAVTALIEGLYRFSFTADQGSSRIGSTNIQIAALCTDGSLRCTQDKLQKCNTDSPPPYWITIQQCPHGCDTDRCRPCSPNARQCSNGELQECRPSPPSYQWQTIEHCAYGCLEGQCAPCPPHICSEISPDSCIYQDGATCHPTQEAAPPDDPDSPLPESLSEATTHTETATPTNDAMHPEPHQPHQPDNALLPDEIARPEGAVIILEPAPPHLQPRGGCLCHASNSPFPAFSLLLFLLLAYRKRNA
jgi:hypothetical protein